jgi:hypothetical protein
MTELETDLRTWMHERAGRVHASPKAATRSAWMRSMPAVGG